MLLLQEVKEFRDMKEKDLPIDLTKHKVYSKNAKKCVQKLLKRYYDEKTAFRLWEKVQLQYCEYLKDEPALKDLKITTSIYDPILIFAWYAVIPDKPALEEVQQDIYQSFFGSFELMGKVFDLNRHPEGVPCAEGGLGHDNEQVLRGVSFTAKEGEVTALVGPSGSGKSTCARLAARLWDIDSGTIRVGGVNIADIDPETLLTDYSMVFQDVVLFDDTVMENIRLGKHGASDEEVLAAARAANCDEFVEKLPQGYATPIGENGAKLSGGERQRISIARALLKNAPIVLLDEATASLDVENETKVQGALSRLLLGKTVLVIAHRMRTVEAADKRATPAH